MEYGCQLKIKITPRISITAIFALKIVTVLFFPTGFGFFVDEQGSMVKKPQVSDIF